VLIIRKQTSLTGDSEVEPVHVTWFRSVEKEIGDEYRRLHAKASDDPQWAGHGGESTWVRILKNWLPEAYTVVTRRYILLETGGRSPEIDIVVLRPSYPAPLRERAEILAGGVAAAFSVRLTIDAAGIRDGFERAVTLRRGLHLRGGSPKDQILAPFPVGVLAHSHIWMSENANWNVYILLNKLDLELANHPCESLDYLCIADLGLWSTSRVPYCLPDSVMAKTDLHRVEGLALSSVGELSADEMTFPVASLITHLLARMSYTDPSLQPWADNLREMGMLGGLGGQARQWSLNAVYNETACDELRRIAALGEPNPWNVSLA